MVNLFDIARQAGGGTALDVLAQRAGMGTGEARRAVEALLPAFTLAFQRSAANPAAFAELIGSIGSGRYAPFYDGAPFGRAPDRAASGDALVAQLFRSPEAAGQVAAQAAEMTGLGAQVVAGMLPTVAGMLIGGMFRYATAEGFADLLRQWSEALKVASRNVAANVAPHAPKPAADPWTAWADVATAMMGGAKPAPKAPQPQDPVAAWTAMMGALVGGGPPEPVPPPAPPQPNPFETLSQMFDTGREVQARHLAAMQTILDRVWGAPQTR